MFVKRLVEKASRKPGSTIDGLKGCEVEPHLAFHYGIASGSAMSAYDSIQKILAFSTKDGRIKLFGKDNSQILLESKDPIPSKFLHFMENQGCLLNVTSDNQIEVWDIDKKLLAHVHVFEEEITSFTVLQQSPYMYVGDYLGNVSILKFDQSLCNIIQMKYMIHVSASRGNPAEVTGDTSITHILPQPTTELKRVLLIFNDGLITLWEIKKSKSIFITGGNNKTYQEAKKVTSACWVCPLGSKVAVGYSNGDVLIWAILYGQNPKSESVSENSSRIGPLYNLNLGYKLDKIPIASLRCNYVDAKTSRLYVMGASSNSLQVVLLNDQIEARMIKLGLQLSEPCIDMEIVSSLSDHSKNKQDECLLLLGKSGCVYAYDDSLIDKYLLQQCQSRSGSGTSLPKEAMLKIPFVDSNITVARFFTNNSSSLYVSDEDYIQRTKDIPSIFLSESKSKEVTYLNTVQFGGFSKVENLYISGHNDGSINFWDASCPIFIPIFSLQQQSEDDFSLSGIPVTALHFDGSSQILVSGDHNGMVRVFKFRPEPYAADNNFMSFQGNTKKRNNHIIQSVKLVKVDGSILAINISPRSNHLAVGSDKGYVSLFDIQGSNLIYQKRVASEISTGIISLQFDSCNLQGFEKNVLTIATKDSSILALDSETGNTLSSSMVHPKKPSRALFMQILYGQDDLQLGKGISSAVDGGLPKQSLVLLCSEKAAYIYSFVHAVQGIKKVLYKKKFHSSCCWASTFYSTSDVGLLLVFATGKIETRSLPELSLLKETSIRGFRYSPSKVNSLPESIICSSKDGELLLVNGDQEIFIVSVLCHNKIFRILDSVSHIYRKDYMLSQEWATAHKEKKKGIFTSVFQEIAGSKAKQAPDIEIEDTSESVEELSQIFSSSNFLPVDIKIIEGSDKLDANKDNSELDIDDIELEDPVEKPKEQSMLAANKQKLASTFNSFKGKLKQMKIKTEKNSSKEEKPDLNADNKAGAVDQIKKKYGFSSAADNTSVAKVTESKLQENLKKLQGINQRATDMQDTAKSFSSMATQLLRTAEQNIRINYV